MYFYQGMTSAAIAREMDLSRSSVSRLISYAKENGYVDIRILDPIEQPLVLEKEILDHYPVQKVHVVPVPEIVGEAEWLERVAQYTAKCLNTLFDSNMILGVAWGTTLSAISRYLLPKATHNSQIVQLNGAGNTRTMGIEYASEIIMRFAASYQARAHLFPVPTFFDYASTKNALWKERSIQRILQLQEQADLLLFSIGAVNAGVPSHVYAGGYLEERDLDEIKKYRIVGDIATVFFREDGSFENISLNRRTSGPNLNLFRKKHGVCVVSGLAKVKGLHAAMLGGLVKELILDEPTARALTEQQKAKPLSN
ncbi:MAG: sugar-binding transcriptional regulator [Anaerolineaceae bacterium]|nr:MAG: sugar-binding transcriptional regulator [Anaerolineaceae bacterium]